MLTRPSTTCAFDSLAKATLLATLASLGIHAGVLAVRARDTCAVATEGLDPQGTLVVARHVLACHDYEHGRITKDEYHAAIAPPRALHIAGPRVMWASSVLGFSTEYTDASWSATQVLGAPDVYPQHGDHVKAWASKTADDQDEWIEVGYEVPRAVSAVEIYETFNPGAVASIELVTTSGRRILLPSPPYPQLDQVLVRKNTIATTCTSEPVSAVRINLSSSTVQGWNEIDAIGLVPCAQTSRP